RTQALGEGVGKDHPAPPFILRIARVSRPLKCSACQLQRTAYLTLFEHDQRLDVHRPGVQPPSPSGDRPVQPKLTIVSSGEVNRIPGCVEDRVSGLKVVATFQGRL